MEAVLKLELLDNQFWVQVLPWNVVKEIKAIMIAVWKEKPVVEENWQSEEKLIKDSFSRV